ncbi:MAG: HupU protein [Gallionella sp.]|nr:HupU protein [Gallionella sp.]MCK9353770.1 HupU protein [Gallionella sp.]
MSGNQNSLQKSLNLLWLQSGGCGGCTLSLLNADCRNLFDTLHVLGINLLWHPSLSEQSADEARKIVDDCLNGDTRLDILCLEGAVLRGPFGTGGFHQTGRGDTMKDLLERLAKVARHTVAVGSCAAFGGVTSGGCNPTDACGLQYEGDAPGGLLGEDYRAGGGLPVVNIAGCPTHPNWVVETLAALGAGELREESLDVYRRPRLYADHLVHHGCTRNEYYEFKASAHKPSDLGCLMENMGCKGTQVHADCNIRLWNGEGSCVRGGYACIACTEPGFEEPGHPFGVTPKVAGIPIGLPTDMPKAWFVALASLSKSATPKRVKENAVADHQVIPPVAKRTRAK